MKKLSLLVGAIMAFSMNSHAQDYSISGYKGLIDAGYSVGVGDYEFGRFEINTSHGYQVNPYLFLGAGAGLHFMSSYETDGSDIPLDIRESKVDIPVFANVRYNFSKKKVAPFVDAKAGTFVTNNGGLYLNASLGCRVALNEKQAVSVAVGYTSEKLEFETFNRFTSSSNMDYTRTATKYDIEAITVKVGFEF